MKKCVALICILVTVFSSNNFVQAHDNHLDDRQVVKLFLASACVGAGLTVIVQNTIIPALTNRKAEKQRDHAYNLNEKIRNKCKNTKTIAETASLNVLKKQINEMKTDKKSLQELLQTVPFKENDASKNGKPLQEVVALLDKQLDYFEQHYAKNYLNKLLLGYSQELNLLNNNNLNQEKVKALVDQRCGTTTFRHQQYIEDLEYDIQTCNMLFEQINQDVPMIDEKEKLETLNYLLRIMTGLLTPDLQHDLVERREEKRKETIHEAEVARIRNEAEYYHKRQEVCRDKQKMIREHKTMMEDVQKTVQIIKEKINQTHQLEQFLRNIDQRSSENRIIESVKQSIIRQQERNQMIIQQLQHELHIIQERMSGNYNQQPNQSDNIFIPPPPENPEYTAHTYAGASAPQP